MLGFLLGSLDAGENAPPRWRPSNGTADSRTAGDSMPMYKVSQVFLDGSELGGGCPVSRSCRCGARFPTRGEIVGGASVRAPRG